jgi:predicted membrane chloride channel (bestrophin family)
MRSNIVSIGTIAITAFIPWILTMAGISATTEFPRFIAIIIHYFMDIALFGLAFGWYFKGHLNANPFRVMSITLCVFGCFRADLFWNFL